MAAADQEIHVSTVRPRSYQDESYQHGFLGAVGDLQKEGELQDVVLEVEGRRFPCHRLVLSAASPYFRAMFTSDMAESRQNTVVLQGLDADMFEEILSYIYSGTLHVSLDRVQPLYQAADLLHLDYVRDTCSRYMAMNVERSTCVDLYKFADVFMVDVVQNSCLQFICGHFVEVASSEEFCSLSVDQLTEIISEDKLEVKEETRVWEAVVRWVQHSREDRLQHLRSILPHIRFNLLTSDDTAAILEHPLVREDHGSSVVIRDAVHSRCFNWKPRLGMTTEMVLLSSVSEIEMLWMNPGEGKYIRCDYDLPVSPLMGTVTPDNEIYILDANSHNITLCKYNHVEDKWEQKSTVYEGRRDLLSEPNDYLMEIDGHLFYLLVPGVVLKKYNQHTNEWHNCSTFQHYGQLECDVAVSCNQCIYLLTRTEMYWYDPREDQWTGKPLSDYSPEVEAEFCTAVAMGTEIFCTDYNFSKTMVYDTEADRWLERPGLLDLNPDIEDVTLYVLQNTLHALVNYGVDVSPVVSRLCQQVYVYNRWEGVWRESSIMPFGRWSMLYPMYPVARVYLPYLNASQEETQGAANPAGPQGE